MVLKCISICFQNPLQGWGLHHCPGQPGPTPDHSLSKEIFPNIQSKPPLISRLCVPLSSWSSMPLRPCTDTTRAEAATTQPARRGRTGTGLPRNTEHQSRAEPAQDEVPQEVRTASETTRTPTVETEQFMVERTSGGPYSNPLLQAELASKLSQDAWGLIWPRSEYSQGWRSRHLSGGDSFLSVTVLYWWAPDQTLSPDGSWVLKRGEGPHR